MSKVVIPISVQLGNSLQQIQQVNTGFQQLAQTASQPLAVASVAPVVSIKRQLREANIELQNAVANFGKLSPEAQKAAKKVADLRDVVEDSAKAAGAADFEDRFQVAGKAVAGVAGAFQTVTALQAAFGAESKTTEEALKKVQAAMALTQGISAVLEGKKAFEALGASATAALKGIKTGVAATGIGLLLIAVGTLVAYWDDIKEAITGVSEEQKKLVKEQNRSVESAAKQVEIIKDTEETLKAQGKSEREILKDKQKAVLFELEKRIAVIGTNIELRKQRIEATQSSQEALTGILKILNFGTDAIFFAIESIASGPFAKLLNKVGLVSDETLNKIKNSRKDFNQYLSSLLFDPEKEKQAAQQATDADIKAIRQLRNEYDQYQNQIKKLDADATKSKQEKAKERAKLEEEANKILLEINRSGTTKTQQEIFKIQDEYKEKRKKLAEAGITDFKALNEAEARDIAKVELQATSDALKARQNYYNLLGKVIVEGLKKAKQIQEQENANIQSSRDLSFRAELSGIKNEYDKRNAELRNAENKDMDALEKAYSEKKISLEKFLQDQAAIEAFYANQRAANNADRNKKTEEELKAFQEKYTGLVEDGLKDLAETLGKSIGEGDDPFAQLAQSIGESLANFAISLGKDLVKLGSLFELLSKALNKLKPPGLKVAAGLALIAFGAAIKASIGKKSQNKFATGGFVSGPGTETSDSIPARLSKGEYVVQAKSVRKYGTSTMDKINAGQVPVSSLSMATERTNWRALINRSQGIEMFSEGGLVTASSRGTWRALINRSEVPIPYTQGDPWRAIVNRSEVPNIVGESFQKGQPYILTTKISGQDLKLILERADRRFSNAT